MISTAPLGPALARTTTSAPCPSPAFAPDTSGPERAWAMLISGKYEVIEAYEDGARYYLAFAEVGVQRSLLSVRETQVAAFVAVGCPLKTAAFSLGISIATAGRACASALEKLGIPNRTVLAAHWGSILVPSAGASATAA